MIGIGRVGWLKRVWVRRILAGAVLCGLAVVVIFGGYLWLVVVRHDRTVALPAPTGGYRVGRVAFDWTDPGRVDPLAPHSRSDRELSVWLWYPAGDSPAGHRAPYAPDAWSRLHISSIPGLGETRFSAVHTHSFEGVPVAPGRFPMVVFEPGMGLAAPQYAGIAENLASYGYLVAGVTPTYSANNTVLRGHPVGRTRAGNPANLSTAQGDRLIKIWAADAAFTASRVAALDRAGRFADHVDHARVSFVGHSFGGAASIEACRADPRCAGAVDLDGTQFGSVVHSGLRAPLMIIGSENSCVTGTCRASNAEDRSERNTARSLLEASSGPAWCYALGGTEHFNFTDYAAYYLAAPLRYLLPLGSINGADGLRTTDAYVAAFLAHTVHGGRAGILDRRSSCG